MPHMHKLKTKYLSIKEAKRMLNEHSFFDVETGNYKVEGGTYEYVMQLLDYCEEKLNQVKDDLVILTSDIKEMHKD
jgi:DNA-directed RNA polymerase subunit F